MESPESLAKGMLSKGIPANPGELSISPRTGRGSAQPEENQVPRETRASPGSEQTLDEEYLLSRETGGGREGSRAVVRTHSTCEGGEPQGSRKGRPRDPLEGRGEQVDVSKERRIHETRNSRKYVKWNSVE